MPKAKDFPSEGPKRRVMVGAIGACVHNLGVEGFADWMEDKELGYASVKLGPAVPIPEVINKIREARPEVVGISMRLGDLHVDKLISEFIELATQYGIHPDDSGIRYAFSGLRPAANVVRAMTGIDYAAPWRGYTTKAEAAALVKANGGVEGLLSGALAEEVPVNFAQRGDVVLIWHAGSLAAGLVALDGRVAGQGRKRVELLPRSAAVRAWRI